ncbi:MAG: hypothetical protein Kow0059_03330 [Candidatus Sumerlaeia bacterium]
MNPITPHLNISRSHPRDGAIRCARSANRLRQKAGRQRRRLFLPFHRRGAPLQRPLPFRLHQSVPRLISRPGPERGATAV